MRTLDSVLRTACILGVLKASLETYTKASLETYTIGQLAARTDVSVETIRYYERVGMLDQPVRPESGYRRYTEDARKRLVFIRRAKGLNFTLREILELLELRTVSETACGIVQEKAARALNRLKEQTLSLRRMERALQESMAQCRAGRPKGNCPMIEGLEAAEN